MTCEGIKTEYLEYLMARAGLEKDGPEGYGDLCRRMLETEFIPVVEMDENRCYDCCMLRKDFENASGIEWAGDILDGILCDEGTMMEIVLVMAEKIQYEMEDSQYEASTRKWVTELFGNCGLDLYATNERFRKEGSPKEVDRILDNIKFRMIGWDGEGGLFPLFMAQRDQRRAELLVQMNDYIEENYDI